MQKQDNKLSVEDFFLLYHADDISLSNYRVLLERARKRMDYVINFIESIYFGDDPEFPLVYDNSIVGRYGITSRKTNGDKGKFDPEYYRDFVTIIPQAEDGCGEEFPVHKFELIDIQKYEIKVNTRILYSDFEDDMINYVQAYGNPEEMKRIELEQRKRVYHEELQVFRNSLTKDQLKWIDRYIDFDRWSQLKPY
jgi:hypothetical protein